MILMAQNKKKKNAGAVVARKKQNMNDELATQAIMQMMRDQFNDGLSKGYGIAVLVMFWLLHTEHGFGKKRLAKFMRTINDFCIEMLGPGPDGQQKPKEGQFSGISLADIAEALQAECNIYINTETWEMEFPNTRVVRKNETIDKMEA